MSRKRGGSILRPYKGIQFSSILTLSFPTVSVKEEKGYSSLREQHMQMFRVNVKRQHKWARMRTRVIYFQPLILFVLLFQKNIYSVFYNVHKFFK